MTMNFVTGLSRSQREHDVVWVVVDCLTKSTHFQPMRATDSIDALSQLYIREIVRLYEVPISIMFDKDPHFTSSFL